MVLPTRLPAPAQKSSWVSLDRLGLQVPYPEGVPGVRLFEPFSRPLSTSVYVSFLFSEFISGTAFPGTLPPPARGCAGQEAKAVRSGPARAEGAPKSFWGPACQFLPSAKSSPRAQLGGVWAVRPAWDICSRQSRIKGEGWGWGLRTSPSIPSGRLPSRPQAEEQGTADSNRFFSFPLGKERLGVGQVGFSLLTSSLPLPKSDVTQCAPAPRELPRSPWRRRRLGSAAAAGRREEERIPLAANSRSLGSEAEARARRRGRVKNNSIKTSKTFGFILGGGRCF